MSIFHGADSDPQTNGRKFIHTNQFRSPRRGEFFLSGAIPEVYFTAVDLTSDYDIMREAPIAPQLNLNGGSYESHREALSNARAAIKAAITALTVTAPHGRDFQTCPDSLDAFRRAQAEYSDRLRSLEKINEDIYVMWQDIEQQRIARQRR